MWNLYIDFASQHKVELRHVLKLALKFMPLNEEYWMRAADTEEIKMARDIYFKAVRILGKSSKEIWVAFFELELRERLQHERRKAEKKRQEAKNRQLKEQMKNDLNNPSNDNNNQNIEKHDSNEVEKEEDAKPIESERAIVIFSFAIKSIPDLNFGFELWTILSRSKLPPALLASFSAHTLGLLQERFQDNITFYYSLALRMFDDAIKIPKGSLKERMQNSLNNALTIFNQFESEDVTEEEITEKKVELLSAIWRKYREDTQAHGVQNVLEPSYSDLIEQLKNHDIKRESFYLDIVEIEALLKKKEKAWEYSTQSLAAFPKSIPLWLARLRLAINSQTAVQEVEKLFEKALTAIPSKTSYEIRNLYVEFLLGNGNQSLDPLLKFLDKSTLQRSDNMDQLRMNIIDAARKLKGDDGVREVIRRIVACITPTPSASLLSKLADLEREQDNPSVHLIRTIFEKAVQLHGKDSIAVWLNLLEFLKTEKALKEVGTTYWAAKRTLIPSLLPSFIELYHANDNKKVINPEDDDDIVDVDSEFEENGEQNGNHRDDVNMGGDDGDDDDEMLQRVRAQASQSQPRRPSASSKLASTQLRGKTHQFKQKLRSKITSQ